MIDDTPTSVYLYRDDHDILIYVGVTSRQMRRQAEHNRSKDWWPYVAAQEVEHYGTRTEALAREAELIATRTPPFNVSLNVDHDAMRTAYLAFRESADAHSDPVKTLRELHQQIPLGIVEHDDTHLVLVTPAKYAHITSRVIATRQVKTLSATTRCGSLRHVERRGPFTRFTFAVRRGVDVDEPFMRLKMVPTKTGMEFHLRNVQLAA